MCGLGDSVRHMRPFMILMLMMLVVWFSVGDVEFVETVEIWRVWTFGTLIKDLRMITDNKSPLSN